MSVSVRTKITILVAGALILIGGIFLSRLPGRLYSYSRQAAQEPADSAPKETTLFIAGDIMLSRNVGAKISQASDPLLPFRAVADRIKAASLSFANLESPFLGSGPKVTAGMVFKAEPENVAGLKDFAVVQTANNHSADQGDKGLNFTDQLLAANGVGHLGTGEDCHKGTVLERDGIRFGFLAYSYAGYNDGGKKPNPLVCDWNDTDQVLSDIRALRPDADILIVAPHMGTEYMRKPDAGNVTRARQAIDAGADIVIGTHPHWIQPIERYKEGVIFYSLGNFVFDQMWSEDTREGLTATLTFREKALERIEVHPVIIDNYCCPRFADSEESKAILGKINLTSEVLLDKN
ncbi:MAG: CapA family protein [Candidatus Saccharibacteria bacterium]